MTDADNKLLLGPRGEVLQTFTDPDTGYEFEHLMRPEDMKPDPAYYSDQLLEGEQPDIEVKDVIRHVKGQLPDLPEVARSLVFYFHVPRAGFDPERIKAVRSLGAAAILATYKDSAAEWMRDNVEGYQVETRFPEGAEL